MRFAHLPLIGRLASACAGWFLPPFYARIFLAGLHARGYVSPSARLAHPGLERGRNCFIGDRVLIYLDHRGGSVTLADQVQINQDAIIQTGDGGSVSIGSRTSIQPRCQISAYRSAVVIGERVEIAPNCAFYPYNHGIAPGQPIQGQPTWTRGGIVVEDDAWLGYGVIVLDGVRIGAGAVVGAGSVVTSNIPAEAIATGVPARVVGSRRDLERERARSAEF
jgi:acetyltransferase-like isoleucine patch superfamily enzyme